MAQRIYELGVGRDGKSWVTRGDIMPQICGGWMKSELQQKILSILEQENDDAVTVKILIEDPS